jgi:hypothetical protein
MYKVTATNCDGDIVLCEIADDYLKAKKVFYSHYSLIQVDVEDGDTATAYAIIGGRRKKLSYKSIKYTPFRGGKKLYEITVRRENLIVKKSEVYSEFSDAIKRYLQEVEQLKIKGSITLYLISEDDTPKLLEYLVGYTSKNPQDELTVKDQEGNIKFKYKIEQIEDFQKLKEINQEEVDLYW